MIGTIRRYMQKSGAKAILWMTLLALAGSTGVGLVKFSQRHNADSIGVVNDHDITLREFRRKYLEIQNTIQEIRKLYGPQADSILKAWGLDTQVDKMILDGLISEKVLQSAADEVGAQVDSQYLQEKLHDSQFVREYLSNEVPPQALAGGTLDIAALKFNLERQGISEQEFEEKLQDTLRRVLFTHLVEEGVYIPQSQLMDIYEKYFLKKKFAILTVPLEQYVTKARAEKLTDTDIENYYTSHKEEYRIPEKRSARLWTFEVDNFGMTISPKDLEAEYHKRKRNFIEKPEELEVKHILITYDDKNKIEMRGKAQELLKKVKDDPKAFEALASQNSLSKDKGSTISFKRGERNRLFEQAATALGTNEISAVIETPEGFEIIKLIGKKDPVFKPFEKVKESLLKTLKQERFIPDFTGNAQRVVAQASDLPEVLSKFIADKKAVQSTLENREVQETTESKKLFGLAKVGDKAFFVDGGKGFILELSGITPSDIPQLATIKDTVVQDMYKVKARSLMEADLAAEKTKLGQAKGSLEDAVKNLKGTLELTDWLDASNNAALAKLREKKVPVNDMLSLRKKEDVFFAVEPQGGYLIEVKEVEPFVEKAFSEKKVVLKQQLKQQQARELVPSLVEALKEKATIDIKKDLVRGAARG